MRNCCNCCCNCGCNNCFRNRNCSRFGFNNAWALWLLLFFL
ncbi:hypothetical protein [uncultured Clostridium sp.]|nr:hypothetical protein [uncultured Clostridium sp.]